MKEWQITYTLDKHVFEIAIIEATTYTMAIIELLRKYPNAEYTDIKELIK